MPSARHDAGKELTVKLTMYQIDAFASRPFEGNPAAVCPLDRWLPDETMQAIAAENNLSETAFFVPSGDGYHIRWFTPSCEVRLCGHATLAAAFVLFDSMDHRDDAVRFESLSGPLTVARRGERLEMDFPAQPPSPCKTPPAMVEAFGTEPAVCLAAEDYLVVFEDSRDVVGAAPDMAALSRLDRRGVAITARSDDHDFVTRFFAPKLGIDEDAVTGSAFTELIPYWAEVLGRRDLTAVQASRRGGEVWGRLAGERVVIGGKAAKYLLGSIEIPV
jgi:PhzF family phenazine biosynthesis protein